MNVEAEIQKVYGAAGTPVVCDGIINEEHYKAANLKIVWLLREPWFAETWSMLRSANSIYSTMGNSPTWHTMAYVVYSILNSFPTWREMNYLREQPAMAEFLRSIAYINVKKSVGTTASDPNEIYSWFKKGEHIIRHQVTTIKPDVVIGCAPFMRDVFAWYDGYAPLATEGTAAYLSGADSPLLIQAYHPSCRIKRQRYVDDMVSIVRARFGVSHDSSAT
jgi:hypothetical protein